MPIYLWSRRHPSTPISLFGLITISAPYLPIALVAFSWILSGSFKAAASDLIGCAVGHVGWFMRDVWTREMVGGPTFFSEPPKRLYGFFSFCHTFLTKDLATGKGCLGNINSQKAWLIISWTHGGTQCIQVKDSVRKFQKVISPCSTWSGFYYISFIGILAPILTTWMCFAYV